MNCRERAKEVIQFWAMVTTFLIYKIYNSVCIKEYDHNLLERRGILKAS